MTLSYQSIISPHITLVSLVSLIFLDRWSTSLEMLVEKAHKTAVASLIFRSNFGVFQISSAVAVSAFSNSKEIEIFPENKRALT